jgi:predicted nucleic-acid-binding Zn-ribbon protein
MWICGNCQEGLDDQFDACWNCGCSREGKLALDFLKDNAAASRGEAVNEPIADGFTCPHCGHRESRRRQLRLRGIGLQALWAEDFLAVSCAECGRTEFYSLSVCQQRSGLSNFLRGLMGG